MLSLLSLHLTTFTWLITIWLVSISQQFHEIMRRKIIQIKLHDKLSATLSASHTMSEGKLRKGGRERGMENRVREREEEKSKCVGQRVCVMSVQIEKAINSVHIFHGTQCV